MKRIAAALSAAALTAAPLLLASPASADAIVQFTPVRPGMVGVQQTLSASVSQPGDVVGGDVGTVTFAANGQNIGVDSVGGPNGSTASVVWTPSAAGSSVNLTATFSGGGSDATSTAVAQVPTSASITVPGSAGANSQVSLGAQVRAKSGSYVPTGTVTFYTANGASIGNANLDGSGKANIQYTVPGSGSSVSLYVVYNGDANATASGRSASDTIKITNAPPSVTLVVAQTNYAGSPTQLTAKINPPSGTGTVAFSANSTALGNANVANGVATITWTPPSTGNFTLKAVYSGGNGVPAGTATNPVNVIQPLKPDTITINPAGAAGPWPAGSTQGLPNGATVQLNVASASGLPVNLAVTNPCSLAGTTLNVLGVGAPCTLTATTAGGNGFAPGNQSWTIVQGVGTQTATVSPAPSGVYKRGASLRLAPVSARTNLGKPITWAVTSGKAACKVTKAKGTWKVKLVKKGGCTVQGSAPAVPGQWAAFSTSASYTVR